MMEPRAFGIDFGTCNCVIGRSDGVTTNLARFISDEGEASSYRSMLYFSDDGDEVLSGAPALREFVANAGSGRLIQSFKSFLANRRLSRIQVGSRFFSFEELLALFFRQLFDAAGGAHEIGAEDIVVGRPVRFVSAHDEEDELEALSRISKALKIVGFKDVVFEYEPIAASHNYRRRIAHEEIVLVGDFGAGTSDLCIVKLPPPGRKVDVTNILAVDGLPWGGDDFDGELLKSKFRQSLGFEDYYVSELGKRLMIPHWLLEHLRQKHSCFRLNDRSTVRVIEEIGALISSSHPFQNFRQLVSERLMLLLYDRIEQAKCALSSQDESPIEFHHGGLDLVAMVTGVEFPEILRNYRGELGSKLDELLQAAGLTAAQIDKVFLTGGSSGITSIREIFEERFGAQKIAGGDELSSVAKGLADVAYETFR